MRNKTDIKKQFSKKVTYLIIIISSLVIASLFTINPSIASDTDNKSIGKIISGPSSARLTTSCNVDLNPEDCIEVRSYDRDGDGENDLLVYNRQVIAEYSGILDGTVIMFQTVTRDLTNNIEKGTATSLFTGKIGDSEPGTMSMITTFLLDASQPPSRKWAGNSIVIEGSGLDGLEGICGGGSYEGSAPPPTSTSWYEFRFGDACRGNM